MKRVQKAGDHANQVQIGGDDDPAEDRRRIAWPHALFALALAAAGVTTAIVIWVGR